MKFVCEQCGSRYNISDERVRNKVLRIRCKKCSNIVEVRDPGLRDSPEAVREPTGSVKEEKPSRVPVPRPKSKSKDKKTKGPDGSVAKPKPEPKDKDKKTKGSRDSVSEPARKSAPKDNAKKDKGPGGSVLADKFAATFRAGKKTDSKGTPGLYKAVKQSAKVMEKQDVDLAHWFAAINKTATGPVSARKVLEHKRAGRVTDDSLVWKEGMPDWVRLRNCKELVGLLARLELVEGEKASVPPPPPPESAVQRKGLFAERDTKTEEPLKGSALGVLTEHAEEEVSGDGTLGSEGLDIEELEAKIDEVEPNPEDSFFAGQASNTRSGIAVALADGQMADIQSLSPPRPVGPNRVMVIASVGFFIAAMGLLGVVLFGGQTAETQTVSNNVTKVIEKVVYRDRYIRAEAGEDQEDEDGDQQEQKKTGQRQNGKAGRAKAKVSNDTKPAEQPADKRTQALMERFGMAGDKGAVGRVNKNARPGSKAGSTLSANDFKRVVTKNQNILKACYERALKTGGAPSDKDVRVNFRLMVGASGSVTSVNLGGEGASYKSLSSCLQRAVKKWVFPASGSSSPVEFPFVFTPR